MLSLAWLTLSGWFRKLSGYFVLAGFFILALLGFWVSGRNSGKNAEEAENAKDKLKENEAAHEDRIQNIEVARDVKEDVSKLESGAASDKLRDKWSRD